MAVAASMGVFDGIHRGHRDLLSETLRRASELNTEAWVISFERHPAQIVKPADFQGSLQTLCQKVEMLDELGFAGVLLLPFDQAFRDIDAGAFLRQLCTRLPLLRFLVGRNFRLGKYPGTAAMDLPSLREGLRVDIVDLAQDNGAPISSSRIREGVMAGRFAEVKGLLGRDYEIDLRGIPLLRQGEQHGIRRAWTDQVLPREGDFVLELIFDDESRQNVRAKAEAWGLSWDQAPPGPLRGLRFNVRH